MNPQNGLVGDNFGTQLPEMQVDPKELMEERRKAKFSRTTEFKKLKAEIEARIDFYQKVLPDGRPLTAVSEGERGYMWLAANCIVGELNRIIDSYESANEAIKDA